MTVCLVTIAKNEGRFLTEWMAHYLSLGVDHIFLFDNESSDHTREIVSAVAGTFPVTYVRWPTPSNRSPQVAAYNHALTRLAGDYTWAGFFDCDEFLVLRKDATIQDFLSRYDASVGALAINWLSFGSSGRRDSDYESVTETFRLGGDRSWRNNKHFKTIARVDALRRMGVHCGDLKYGSYLHPDGEPVSMPQRKGVSARIDHSLAQLNHYQIKSRSDFDEKIRRGRAGKKPSDPLRFRQNGDAVFFSLDQNTTDYAEIDATRERRLAVLASMKEKIAAQVPSDRLGAPGVPVRPSHSLQAASPQAPKARRLLPWRFPSFASLRRDGARRTPATLFSHIRTQLPGFEVGVVFDVGANIGQTLATLTRDAPHATVYAFEPVTAAYRQLLIQANGRSNIHCIHAALGTSPGTVLISSFGTKTSNRILKTPVSGQSEQANMMTGDGFCAERGIARISYLKVDTEGHDLDVLLGFRSLLENGGVDLIEIEAGINPGNTWHVPLHDFTEFLHPLGYRIFQFYDQKFEKAEPVLRRVNAAFISGELASGSGRK